MAETEICQRTPALHKILAADGTTDGEKRECQGRRNPRQFSDRNQKRKAEAQILPHIAVLGQYQPLAPVAGIGEAIVRAAAIHPWLALARVVMSQREVRAGIAE